MIVEAIMNAPASVSTLADGTRRDARRVAGDRWEADGTVVSLAGAGSIALNLVTAGRAIEEVVVRWEAVSPIRPTAVYGDEWERGYGTMGWYPVDPGRVLPWYLLALTDPDGEFGVVEGVGVAAVGSDGKAPAALSSWRIDPAGITLVLDVRSGAQAVAPGDREVALAQVLWRTYQGSSPFDAASDFAALLAGGAGLATAHPVYGGNNWYYAYGTSSREEILADARLIAELAGPDEANRPFMVIDDGWQLCRWPRFNGGPWIPNDDYGTMADLAAAMRESGVRPGIWIRPLLLCAARAAGLAFEPRGLDPDARWDGFILDPSRPETLAWVADETERVASWGFDLIKHDFTTYDILGQWGFQMRGRPASGAWRFADPSRTSAEVIRELYGTIRHAAERGSGTAPNGSAPAGAGAQRSPVIIGCNTIGHLAVGEVHLQRTGDDTSGREWERTRKMGVNTLAFRAHQHGSFFAVDADCVGLTNLVPWAKNAQWLDLVARSGTPLFVSASPDAMGEDQRRAVADAFRIAARDQPPGEPLDWVQTTCPSRWRFGTDTVEYDWY